MNRRGEGLFPFMIFSGLIDETKAPDFRILDLQT